MHDRCEHYHNFWVCQWKRVLASLMGLKWNPVYSTINFFLSLVLLFSVGTKQPVVTFEAVLVCNMLQPNHIFPVVTLLESRSHVSSPVRCWVLPFLCKCHLCFITGICSVAICHSPTGSPWWQLMQVHASEHAPCTNCWLHRLNINIEWWNRRAPPPPWGKAPGRISPNLWNVPLRLQEESI
jgi:hypothetical protein